MPVTDPGSLLLLGAGSSAPFGVPLGGELIDEISQQISRDCDAIVFKGQFGERELSAQKALNIALDPTKWHSHPIIGSLIRTKVDQDCRLTPQKAHDAFNELMALKGLLDDQTAETIDAFIAENPRNSSLTKLAIAAYMLRHLYRPNSEHGPRHLILKPLAARETEARSGSPPQRNWIHLLINIVRHAVDNKLVSKENPINIVTFNYDTILEYVLNRQFQNRETQLAHFADYVNIIHIHGHFKNLEGTCDDPGVVARTWAEGINVVNELQPCEAVQSDRDRARALIREASKIYSIGFSFAGPNCRLLQLHECQSHLARQLIYCNFDGNVGVKESAERYVVAHSIVERAGTWQRPLGATDFVKAGFLGEPPG